MLMLLYWLSLIIIKRNNSDYIDVDYCIYTLEIFIASILKFADYLYSSKYLGTTVLVLLVMLYSKRHYSYCIEDSKTSILIQRA